MRPILFPLPSLGLAWLLVGCSSAPEGPLPVYQPDSAALFDAPWPSDTRLRADGTPDMSGFPNPAGLALIDSYVGLAGAQQGFGNNSPVYLRFDGAIDTALLPTPEASILPGASVFLVDVDARSPHWGERVPVQWDFTPEAYAYQPGNLLAVGPVWGFPLRPGTTYALVVTTDLAAHNPAFAEVWDEAHPDHAVYAPLRDSLFFLGLEPRDVAIATVFTTGDPLAEMTAIVDFLRTSVAKPDLSQSIEAKGKSIFFQTFEGSYPGPLFQHGQRPYATTGGGFQFRDSGVPILNSWEDLRIAVCTPRDLSTPPPEGWPVVIQQHGTGGDYMSHCSSNSSLEVAAQLGKVGFVSIGIDQPLHGTRATASTDADLHSFNYLNPESARANFRQGAVDAIYLAQALSERQTVFTTPEGTEIKLDPERVYFFGHSQGGLTGALALPWMGEEVSAAVLSGAGGGLSITLVERKDYTDIQGMIEQIAGFAEGESLTEMHPVAGIVQQLVDVTDPINYAPYWYAEQGTWGGQAPSSVLLTSGLLDEQTPHRTAEALAAAAQLPQLAPGANEPDGLRLRQLAPVLPPLDGNAIAWDGTPVTGAFSQWADEDHYAVFYNRDLAEIYRNFLASASEGHARIEALD